MKTYILLTRLIGEEVHPVFKLKEREKDVVDKINAYLPEIEWQNCFAVMGPWDYLDILRAPDDEAAMKVSALVRYYGAAHTEIWPAQDWDDFEATLRDLTEVIEK